MTYAIVRASCVIWYASTTLPKSQSAITGSKRRKTQQTVAIRKGNIPDTKASASVGVDFQRLKTMSIPSIPSGITRRP